MTSPSTLPDGLVFERVDYQDPRAVALRATMDEEITARYAARGRPAFTEAVLRVLVIDPADVQATLLVLEGDGRPVAHAALRLLRGDWEVKRVIVLSDQRGRGLGFAVMTELERIAGPAGAGRLILQTGDKQPEAVALYERLGYTRIPVYEPYATAIPRSICFEKALTTAV